MTRPLLQKSIIELEEMFKSARGNVTTLLALANELKHRSTPKAVSLQKHVNAAIAGAGTPFNRTGVQPTLKPKSMAPDEDVQSPTGAVSIKPTAPANAPFKATIPPVARAPKSSAPQSVPSNPDPSIQSAPASSVPSPATINPKLTPTPAPLALKPVIDPAKPTAQGDAKIESTELAESLSVEEAYSVLRCAPGSSWEVIEQCRRDLVQLAHPANLANMSVEQRQAHEAHARKANLAYAVLFAMQLK